MPGSAAPNSSTRRAISARPGGGGRRWPAANQSRTAPIARTGSFANMACDRSNPAGWPCDEEVERLRTAYASAAAAARPAILETLQRRLAAVNPYRLLGQATQPVAYRTTLHGVLDSPVVAYWNISKE